MWAEISPCLGIPMFLLTFTTAPASPMDRRASLGGPYQGDYLQGTPPLISRWAKTSGSASAPQCVALNVADHRVLYDNSLTFGGFHWDLPREVYVQVRYRFHY